MADDIQIVVSGWKARRDQARIKNNQGKTKEERQAIRDARRALYEQQAAEQRKVMDPPKGPDSVSESEAKAAVSEVSSREPESVSELMGEQEPIKQPEYEEIELTREQMIAELKAAGQKVGGNIKDETLVERVEALRNGEDETQA